jgi:hypothetical protein
MQRKRTGVVVIMTLAVGVLIGWAVAQDQPKQSDERAKYKYTTETPPGIASPDRVETRLGTLKFFDGFPDKASVEKLYDNLDFQRAVQAYLLALPPVSQAANRNPIRALGPVSGTVPIFEQLMDSRSVFLTANTNTVYSWAWLDLRNGPLVVEVPPKVLGAVNDMWYRWVTDVGITGPDKGCSLSSVPNHAAFASMISCGMS